MTDHAGKYAHHSYQGWKVVCECGWESKWYRWRNDADSELVIHIAQETVNEKAGGVS